MKKILSWIIKLWPTLRAGVKKGAAAVAAGVVWLWAKVKAVKWTRTKAVALGVVIALIAVTAVTINLVRHKQQPVATAAKTTVKKVVESPTAKQTRATDTATITERSTVKVSGKVKVKAKTTATAKEPKTQYTIPLTGTANTTYTDTAGATVGQGSHKVTGQANVTVTDDTATADVTINDTNQVAVMTEPGKKYKNEAGYFYDGDQQIYYKRNVVTYGKILEFSGYVGGRLNIDDVDESRVEAGVRVRW